MSRRGRASKRAEGLSDASRSLLGYILGAYWVHLGAPLGSPRAVLGVSWAHWVPRGCLCGPLGGLLGASWSILGLFGGLLGPPWGPMGASWAPLGAILKEVDQRRGGL